MKKIFDINFALRKSRIELVSGDSGAFTRSGTLYYQDDNGVFRSVAADTPAFVNDGLVHVGAYRQECLDSEDVGEWSNIGTTVTPTGETVNGLNQFSVQSGASFSRCMYWAGSNPAKQCHVVRYVAGSSGKIFIDAQDVPNGLETLITGTIGESLSFSAAGGGHSASVAILSDADTDNGYRKLVFTVDWINPTSNLRVGIGSYEAGKTILVYSADVFESNYELPHVPSSGSTVSIATQAADGAGNGLVYDVSNLDSRVLNVLDGTSSGTILTQITPKFDSDQIDGTYRKILSSTNPIVQVNDTNLSVSDGTNTATVAHGGFSADDTITVAIKADGDNSELTIGLVGDNSITWGDAADYTGALGSSGEILINEDNEDYLIVGYAAVYEGVPGSDAEVVIARNQMLHFPAAMQTRNIGQPSRFLRGSLSALAARKISSLLIR